MKHSSIKIVRPIDAQSVSNAPWVAVKSASKLTGLGNRLLRTFSIKRFGKTDFVKVEDINRFIGEEEGPQPEDAQ